MTHSSPPRTPVEETIAAIWADVLGHTDIGVFDDFFELGGHSLLAPRVVARIRKTLGVQIPVMDFFDGPTVAQLAAVVNARSSAQPQVIGRRAPDAAPVLSFDQQRLWLENQLLPGAAYNVHGRRRLVGAVDVGALQASVRAILARHESLRTRFPTVDGQPQQIVDDADPGWRLDVRDLRDHDGDREAAALSLADEQATTPFDLAEGPLFRCQLIRLTGTVHVLSVTMHHIVSDAWSIGLFVRELSALYQAGGDAERAGLAPLPIQFRDYAVWQRRWLSGDRLEKQLDHWRTHLAGAPPTLALPTGRRLLTTQGGAADTIPFEFTVDETTALRGLCRKHGVTPFMTLLAGLSTVLSRWSGQSDVVIGVPLASRGNPGTDAMIGFLVNTLPMRVRLADAATFADLLTQVRQTALDGYAHADAPLDTLVREAQATRDPRRTPLFQAVLNVMGAPEAEQVTGIEIQAMDDTPAVPSKFDLALIAKEVHGALQLQLYFNGGRFPASVMRLLAGQLAVFLRGVLDDPARGLLDYPLEPVRQPQPAVKPPAASLDLARHGGRIAVIDDAGGWSYRWLDEAAGRVAAELGARGVGSGDHLAVVRRPVAAFAAVLLGCRRVGATFAVVEPESVVPAAYLGAKLLLDVGSGAADAVDLSEVLPAGGPTAVGGDGDRYAVLSGAPGHRTAALVEALTAGAALVLSEVPLNGDVAGWLREHGITAAYLSPPVLRAAASAAEPGVPGLRDVFVENTGELLAHDVTAAVRLAPQGRFVSLYRIGADGVPLARYEVPAGWRPDEAPLRVPLGVELPGVPASLRHAGGQPAAVNEVAGLHFGTHDTGDLARRSPDGTLAFVRRVDASPLIDLAETVGALRDLPGVHDAVVVEELGPDGETVLAGYLTGPEPGGPTVGFRQQLLLRLPGFLIPARLVVLGRLPLTADGAYDLDALGDQDATTGHSDYVAPRTPMERQLIEILQELLGLERIGIHDSFFELGGFSLLATQLTTRIREQFGVEPSLRDVFESPTVDELAQLIVRAQFTLTGADGLEALLDEIVSAEPGRG